MSIQWGNQMGAASAAAPLVNAVRLYKTGGNQTPTTFTDVPITLTGIDYQRGTVIGTGTANSLTATVAGLYLVTSEVNLVGGAAGVRSCLIKVNGSTVREFGLTVAGRASANAVLLLAAGDVVSLNIYVEPASVVVTATASKDVGLTLAYLGAAATAV